ncbi:MAG: phosphodiester glycosidase family protein [Clostridia bacterium]|nr:phosphodiester glycosidase family protein [Clostridia bacterium]
MKNKSKRKTNAGKITKRILLCVFTALILLCAFILGGVAVINYGPSKTARDLFVVSMLETSAAKFLATWYFSGDEINSIVNENAVIPDDGLSDPSLININPGRTPETKQADYYFPFDEKGQPVVTEERPPEDTNGAETDAPEDPPVINPDREPLEIVEVRGSSYAGFLMKVADPSRLFVGVCGNYGDESSGKTIMQIAKSYKATAAINAGGFEDKNGTGNGGIPLGLVISQGNLLYGNPSTKYDVIGFNKNNILIVGNMTAQAALDAGIRDAVSFGPVLVMNGKASSVKGAGSGVNPRTAIGQCADGTVLLLVIDGRQASSLGATYADLIEIMLKHGAVNAANLDGGTSSGMYYDGKLVNKGLFFRGLPTCFIVK